MWNSFPACPLGEIHYQPDTLRITRDMNFVPSLRVNDDAIFERSIFGPQHCAPSKQQSVISRRNHKNFVHLQKKPKGYSVKRKTRATPVQFFGCRREGAKHSPATFGGITSAPSNSHAGKNVQHARDDRYTAKLLIAKGFSPTTSSRLSSAQSEELSRCSSECTEMCGGFSGTYSFREIKIRWISSFADGYPKREATFVY